MEGVHIVVEVIDPRDDAVTLAVHTGEAPRKAFGRSCKDRVVEVVLLLVFAHHFVNHLHGIIERLPRAVAASVTLTIESHHRIVPTDEADTERATVEDRAHFVLWSEGCTTLPHVIAHHEGELTS